MFFQGNCGIIRWSNALHLDSPTGGQKPEFGSIVCDLGNLGPMKSQECL